jgi:predicted lipid-binding transport protein (Tim44 family)
MYTRVRGRARRPNSGLVVPTQRDYEQCGNAQDIINIGACVHPPRPGWTRSDAEQRAPLGAKQSTPKWVPESKEMGDGFQFLDIVLFAMVAAFLVLRLRSVLGKKTGHQEPRQDPVSRRQQDSNDDGNVVELPNNRNNDAPDIHEPDPTESLDPNDPLSAGITQIRIADNTFNPGEFAGGARGAFEMIVQAFADGDADTLKNLLADDVFENFNDAIETRKDADETLETTIIGIKSADMIEAGMDGTNAAVTMKFVSEQVNVTRDSEDRIVDGDPNQVTNITDIWTFSRDTKSRDPNWFLVETRSQN